MIAHPANLTTADPPPKLAPVETDLPPISIVVIGRNEGQRLVRCLESVWAADYPAERIELIYVDSASTDGSCAVADRYGARVEVLSAGRPCAAKARNAGWRLAKQTLIQFLDGDTILSPDWLRCAVAEMQRSGHAAVFGKVQEAHPYASVYNYWAHHDWYVRPGPAESCGGIVLFRADVLRRTGGFDETLIAGEESDLCLRIRRDLKMTLLSVDAPMVLHDINMTRFHQYWKRCVRTGHCYAEVSGRDRSQNAWKRARWRNIGHVAAPILALAVSAYLSAFWPLVLWALLLVTAIMRNALRVRSRVGTLRGAVLYSMHHYIAKLPMAVGQCAYWFRRLLKLRPRRLIEYRA